jgi:hypothetical protein
VKGENSFHIRRDHKCSGAAGVGKPEYFHWPVS